MDARLVPLAAAVWLATLLVPVLPPPWHPVLIVATACPAVLALVLLGRTPRLTLLLFGLAAGCAVAALHVRAVHGGPVGELAARGAVATVELEVRTDPSLRAETEGRGYVMFDARIRAVEARGIRHRVDASVLVAASPGWQGVRPGARVRTVARLAATERGDDQAAFLSARGPPRVVEQPGMVDRLVNQVRAGLREAAGPLPEAERALLPSLVVGDTTRLPAWLSEELQSAGLTHLTAVSGANLTILLGFVLALVRAVGVRAWGVPVVGALVVVGFVLVCRPEPSVIRAAAMGIVGLAGLSSGQRRTGVPALAIAVTVLLLLDPWLGRSYGFALSVLATAGILVFVPGWTVVLERRVPHWLAVGIAVPLAAQLAVTPVLVTLDGEISLVAVVANLLAGPVVPFATVLGFAALLLGLGPSVLAQLAAWAAFPAVWWIVQVAGHASALPGATVEWASGAWSIAALTVGCVLLAIGATLLLRRPRVLIVLAIVLVLWLVRPIPLADTRWLTGWPPDSWALAACDVGQGDALVLHTGPGRAVLVDTGPEPRAVDACLRSLGVRHLDLVVLTHFHRDHVGGLTGALRGRQADRVWIRPVPGSTPAGGTAADGDVGDPGAGAPGAGAPGAGDSATGGETSAGAATVRELGVHGIPVEPVMAGHRIRIGSGWLTVLGPPEYVASTPPGTGANTGEEGTGENDASLVLLAEVSGLRVLLTGDVEPVGQRRLLPWGDALDVDVLKVPHHGARYQDPGFLDRTSPRLALISVGADNDYGHPAPSTLAYFQSRGVPVARTDRDGTILITATADGIGLLRRRNRASGGRHQLAPPDPLPAGEPWVRPPDCRCDVGC